MSNPHEQEIQAALKAAESAFRAGRYREAQHHLAEAAHLGATPQEVARLGHALAAAGKAREHHAGVRRKRGFWLGVLGYGLLSIQQPLTWTLPLWIGLAFLVVPGLVGYVIGRGMGPDRLPRERFWAAWHSAAFCMALYTAINLMLVHSQVGHDADAAQIFLAGLLVTGVYAALAGVVAGLVSEFCGGWGKKEAAHGTAS